MAKLYELSERLRGWMAEVIEADGEITDDLQSQLDDIEPEWCAKVEACIHMIEQLKSDAEAFKAQADRFARQAKACANNAERLRGYVLSEHQRAQRQSTETAFHVVAVRTGPISVNIDGVDVEALPDDLCSVTRKADKKAIRARLEAGQSIEGAELIRRPHLSIRLGRDNGRKS